LVTRREKMFKKILLVLSLFFVFSCEDNEADVEFPMKLWLNGVEVDVEAEYQRITTFAEEIEYVGFDTTKIFVKKILVIHFQKEDSRVDLNKEHYAVIFTDWEGDTFNGLPIDEGQYQWPSICPVCPRACMHGEPSKWVRMEIIGDSDVAVSGTAHIETISQSGDTWTISGNGEGIFYNPYAEANMEGRIEFTNLKVEKDTANTPYSDYGGH
tara:strand:+ start:46 stop:681 length:636 start_codon:yes stop_codon:yes gene_type:complete